jgi:hypothetical protein
MKEPDYHPWLVYAGQDPLKDMEVIIQAGECKSHHAVILGTRKKDNNDLVDVRTTTKVENVILTLEMNDVSHLQ